MGEPRETALEQSNGGVATLYMTRHDSPLIHSPRSGISGLNYDISGAVFFVST